MHKNVILNTSKLLCLKKLWCIFIFLGTRKTAKKSRKINKYVSDSEEDETNDTSEGKAKLYQHDH